MSTYIKPAVLPAWSEAATTPADMVQPDNTFIQGGWPQTSVPPTRQKFNWLLNYLANATRYVMQRGICDWDAAETYMQGARILDPQTHISYASLLDNNVNMPPATSPQAWLRWGFTLADINASQLTQVTQAAGDNTTNVATTGFVAAATAGIATDGQVNALTNRVSTLEGEASGFTTEFAGINASFGSQPSANGYQRFLNGMIMQWMLSPNPVNGRGEIDVNWPIKFPNNVLNVQVSARFEVAVTSANWQGVGMYVQPTTDTTTARIRYDVRSDGSADQPYRAFIFGIGN